jgi:signal transduction histidine kinase/CheY-like chemotaxis protein
MSLILVVSILIRILAALWSIQLFRRVRNWRMLFLTAMLALMATRQSLTLTKALASSDDWSLSLGGHLTEIPGLVVSVLAALAVYFLDRILVERKRSEEVLLEREQQLRQSQKMEAFGLLAGGIAHDFNNLLTAIIGNAQLAAMNLRGNEAALSHLRGTEEAALKAAELTGQILAHARRGEATREVTDPNQLVTELVPMVRQLLDGPPEIELVVLLDETAPAVEVDRSQVNRVVLNLVANARDALPSGGKVTIRLTRAETPDAREAVKLTVADTGTGIAPEVRGRVFEPFCTTKPAGRGTGLGLSICYTIVDDHGGTLEVERSDEQGSTFAVTLPATRAVPARPSEAPGKKPPGGGTVLVVEDEAQVMSVATRGLESLGYRVISALNGVDALSVLESRPGEVDLVLSDVMMPQMGGNELAARLAAAHPRVPVILMSGFAVSASTPVKGFLKKPFTVTELAQAVHAALGSASRVES